MSPTRGENRGEKPGRIHFHPRELVLAGAGYTHAAGIAALVAQQADVCVHLHPAFLRLRDKQGRPFPLLQALKKLQRAGKTASWQVWVVAGKQRIAGRICAIRKSEQTLERVPRKRTRKQSDRPSPAFEERVNLPPEIQSSTKKLRQADTRTGS